MGHKCVRQAIHEVSMKKHNMKKQEPQDTSAGNETSAVQWQIGKMKYTYLKFLWTLYLIFTTMQRKWSLNTLRMCSYFKATGHVKTVHFKSFKWFIIQLAHGRG